MDSKEFNGTFWLSISAMLLSFVGILTVFCLKSKCKKCNICFGLISVERDIDGELEDEKMMIENGMDPYNIEHKNFKIEQLESFIKNECKKEVPNFNDDENDTDGDF